MTHEDWSISTAAKVAGSWNLHEVMQDVDFFIFLSSINGIVGNRGQANYASGNAFEDSLAHYRVSQGLKAATIDLGMMVTEGAMAENESLLNAVRRDGHLIDIKQEELIALLDFYCNPELPLLTDGQHQVVVGLEMPSAITAKGIDVHHILHRPMFSHLFRMGVDTTSKKSMDSHPAQGAINRPAALKAVSSFEDATALVAEWIAHKVAHIIGLQTSNIDPEKPIHVYGIDSLVAVDMKNWFENEIGASITVFDVMGNMSLERLSAMAVQKSRYCQDWQSKAA